MALKMLYFNYDQQQKKQNISIIYVTGLYLYSLGLSTRCVAKAMFFLQMVKKSHVLIWKWIKNHHAYEISSKRKRIMEFIVDETLNKIGSALV